MSSEKVLRSLVATLVAGMLTMGCESVVDVYYPGADAGDGGSSPAPQDCSERIRPVACRAAPPECPSGQFPATEPDGSCWTGDCLDCIDGCQDDTECVVVRACGCFYHEGCQWAESVYRAELLDPCMRALSEGCPSDCSEETCDELECPWCDADWAGCQDGYCYSVVNHECY